MHMGAGSHDKFTVLADRYLTGRGVGVGSAAANPGIERVG
jgi:hypothetical protein